MEPAIPEPRVAVMIVAEAFWEDQGGIPRVVPARLENRSAGGACVRLKARIGVGAKLSIQSRWEQISGTVKYCRSAGDAFLVGIQRDTANGAARDGPISTPAPVQELPPKALVRERNPMQRKWSELLHSHGNQNEDDGNSDGRANGKAIPSSAAREGTTTDAGNDKDKMAGFQIGQFCAEDIYYTAGIMNLKRGFSVGKVAAILHSDRARGLPKDARQAAVLMALEAAGVPIEQVLQDARTRQDALNSQEAELRKEVEAEWARKADENVQIQAELDRVKARYMARISRNLEGVAREKAMFDDWLAMKQKESHSIAEAVQLCLKLATPEASDSSLSSAAAAAAAPR